jgi:signal transduction histidine kinase
MRLYFPTVLRTALFVFLLFSSGAVLYTTAQNTLMVRRLADLALESTALSLSSSAELELRTHAYRRGEQFRQLFSDRVVAYAFIVGEDGQILFHTNPALVGSVLPEKGIGQWLASGRTSGRRVQLKTGLPAFEFNYVLHRPDGRAELLRLVLHTAPADRILAGTQRMWYTIILVLLILWIAGFFLERMFKRQLHLAEQLEKKEKMALIGQMTAVLAHEIRNALGGIKGYTQWVAEKMAPGDSRKDGLSFVLKGTERIEYLVNDLLHFSREETYTLDALAPEPLIREAVALGLPAWDGAIEIEVAPEARIRADRDKFSRVLFNGLQRPARRPGGSKSASRTTARVSPKKRPRNCSPRFLLLKPMERVWDWPIPRKWSKVWEAPSAFSIARNRRGPVCP